MCFFPKTETYLISLFLLYVDLYESKINFKKAPALIMFSFSKDYSMFINSVIFVINKCAIISY